VVFVTTYRHHVFGDRHLARTEEVIRAVCDDVECGLVEVNGETNHMHLLVDFPPKLALSRLVNSVKVSPPAGCAKSPPTCASTTGARNV
jgi:putative transposase